MPSTATVDPLELLVAADRFECQGLCYTLEMQIGKMITRANVCQLLYFAETFSLNALLDVCAIFVLPWLKTISTQPAYSRLSSQTRQHIEKQLSIIGASLEKLDRDDKQAKRATKESA